MKRLFFVLWFTALIFLSACGGSSGTDSNGNSYSVSSSGVYSGKLEKGAFQKGAEIIAYAWSPTSGFSGESFTTTTTDNLGNYTLKSTAIKDLLYIKADGYFYNENTGITSSSTLKLYGIVDSTNVPWNINILTHLIKNRMIKLLESGKTYDQATNQAVTELYSSLGWSAVNPGEVSVATNADLLFLSSAICKDRTVAQVSDLLTALSTDLEDGNVDLTPLHSSFSSVDIAGVTANINSLYGSCPSISAVKSAVLTKLSLEDTSVRQITVIPFTTCPFYLYTDDNKLYGFVTNKLDQLTAQYTQKYLGVTTTENTTIHDFFSIGTGSSKILYFKIKMNYDNSIKMYQQNNSGIVTEISSFPSKPVASEQSVVDTDFESSRSWDGYQYVVTIKAKVAGGTTQRGVLYGYYVVNDWEGNGKGIISVWDYGANNCWMSVNATEPVNGTTIKSIGISNTSRMW